MADIDGGHYFLTTLIPVRLAPDGSADSPSHRLREVLSTLPTAQQSPACVDAGLASPFSRCTRTHFLRAFVIDQPNYNGREGGDALREGLRSVNLLAAQPVDRLSRPWLMFNADFDARQDEPDGGLASWAEGLWARAEDELRAIFASCVDFDRVADGPAFAAWLKRCQVETTMSFNDYGVDAAPAGGYTVGGLALASGLATLVASALAWRALVAAAASNWWLLALVPLAAALALAGVLWMLWRKGSRPFPASADTDLPSILKALFVQQRFVLLAARAQGLGAPDLHAEFGRFLAATRPDDTRGPTQPPGVIRSDGTPLVVHQRIAQPKAFA